MRLPLLSAAAALILVSCGNASVTNPTVIPVSSVLDENARLREENALLRAQPPMTAAEIEQAQVSARDAKRKSDLQAYATAAQLWAADHGEQLPTVGDDEFQGAMVAGKYLARVVPAPSAGEHYCYATNRDRSDYSLSGWLERTDAPYTVGSDMAAAIIAKSTRSAYFSDSCPRIPAWVSVRV
jgi:hypothetical protein